MVEILFRKIALGALTALAAVLTGSMVMTAGIYYGGWRGEAAATFAKVVPIPVAQVNGRYVPLKKWFDGQSAQELIESEITRQIAAPYGAASREQLAIELVKNKPSSKIQKARTDVSLGADFTEITAAVSDDEESRYIGGDLGFLVVDDLPDWMREAVEPLEVGQLSEVVAGPEGYHVFQATARDDESDQSRKQIRQIFVKIDTGLDKLIADKIKNSKIYVFIK